jgi:L-alanine-DL-glutamate epimerase-like enolase superfamily enzyme
MKITDIRVRAFRDTSKRVRDSDGHTHPGDPRDVHQASVSAYVWLAANLDIPVVGPESMNGKFHTRAEWIKAGACDVTRTGAHSVGGIGPSLKIIHLVEAFGMDCEVHGGGAGNLTLGAVQKNGRWYERGLLHPFLNYNEPPEYLNSGPDPMDADGFVHLSQQPGLGEDINFGYINNNLVSR